MGQENFSIFDDIIQKYGGNLRLISETAYQSFSTIALYQGREDVVEFAENIESIKFLISRDSDEGNYFGVNFLMYSGEELSSIGEEWQCYIGDDFNLYVTDLEHEKTIPEQFFHHILALISDWLNRYFENHNFDDFKAFTKKALDKMAMPEDLGEILIVNLSGIQGMGQQCELAFVKEKGNIVALILETSESDSGSVRSSWRRIFEMRYDKLMGDYDRFKSDIFEEFPEYYDFSKKLAHMIFNQYVNAVYDDRSE